MTSEESHRERERTFRYRHNSQHVFLFADTHTRAVDVGTCWVSSVEWGGDGVRENDGRVLQLFVSPAGANNVRVPLQPEAAGWVPCHPRRGGLCPLWVCSERRDRPFGRGGAVK